MTLLIKLYFLLMSCCSLIFVDLLILLHVCILLLSSVSCLNTVARTLQMLRTDLWCLKSFNIVISNPLFIFYFIKATTVYLQFTPDLQLFKVIVCLGWNMFCNVVCDVVIVFQLHRSKQQKTKQQIIALIKARTTELVPEEFCWEQNPIHPMLNQITMMVCINLFTS